MLWFFEKQQATLHYEIRRQFDGDAFELVITHPDGRQDVERFSSQDTLLARSLALERALEAAGWTTPGGHIRVARRVSHR